MHLPEPSFPNSLLYGMGLLANLYWLYMLLISLFGLHPARPLPPAHSYRRFAILIPAHNEARVLGPLLDSLNQQTYPRAWFDIYVSADNCADSTARVARSRGAIVLERFDTTQQGKTWNVPWALERIPLEQYTGLVLFDADNLAHPRFLGRMNDYLEAHPQAEAIQGYLDTKNPNDSWISSSFALSFWFVNRFWQLARQRLGLSGALGGTGLLIQSETLRRMGWNPQSLTEDLEFTVSLVLTGGKVHWNDFAIVYDEKPLTLRASYRQRTRWLQGHYWVLAHYASRAFGLLLRTGRVQYLDTLILLFGPALFALGFVSSSLSGLLWPILQALNEPARLMEEPLGLLWPLNMIIQGLTVVVAGPSLHRRRLTLKYLPMLFPYLFFLITWFPITLHAAWQAQHQNHWDKTAHTRAVRLEELRSDSSLEKSPARWG
ncbi:MAG: glycosyltransferase family 2 protein [Thermaceae bacterium]|nr:glycosyltransferase family 2 protein [Thermaceae bacterium]